jgi:hypothetical protein
MVQVVAVMTRDPEPQTKEAKMNYKYDHIIHILLQKHGWVRVPWFVSLREVQERFYNAR